MKAAMKMMAVGYLAAVVLAYSATSAIDAYKRDQEQSLPIYADPHDVEWQRADGALIVRAISKKLQPCDVVSGSPVYLAVWVGREPMTFPAVKPSGKVLEGRALVSEGDEFVVGPWLIEAEDAILDAVTAVSVRLNCKIASGVERNAEIGPMRRQ